MVNKKCVYIHIGPPKTGTSVIQDYLNRNQKLLSSMGVLYPQHSADPNGISSGNRNEVLSLNQEGEFIVDSVKISRLIDGFKSGAHSTLLLSSEFFFRVAIDLFRQVSACNVEVKLFAYFRDPLEVCESNYNQSVKRHGQINPFQVSEMSIFHQLDRMIEINNEVPANGLTILPFEKIFLYHENIIKDFMYRVLNCEAEEEASNIINPSYSLEALEFKRCVNSYRLETLNQRLDRILQRFQGGTRNYSFLCIEEQNRIRAGAADKIQASFSGSAVMQEFSDFLRSKNPRPYHPQNVLERDLRLVCDYLRINNWFTFKFIQYMASHKNIYLVPYSFFFSALGVNPPSISSIFTKEELERLCCRLSEGDSVLPEKLCEEMSDFTYKGGNIELSLAFANAGLAFNPTNTVLNSRVNTCKKRRTPRIMFFNFFFRLFK